MTTPNDTANHRAYTRPLELLREASSSMDRVLAAVPEEDEAVGAAAELRVAIEEAESLVERAIAKLDFVAASARRLLLRESAADEAEEVEQLFNV